MDSAHHGTESDALSRRARIECPEVASGTTRAFLVDIWSRFLPRSPETIDDDFFEIGGHSLALVRLLESVRQEFGVELPVERLFRDGFTIRAMASVIDASVDEAQEVTPQADDRG